LSAFEFFFSFYGLLLGFSVAVLATGVARAFKHRKTVPAGWLTPLLALFVALDITTFWDAAWNSFRDLQYSYGLLVAGLIVATVYFIAASLLFPEPDDQAATLDEHFWANKKAVLVLLIAAKLLNAGVLALIYLPRPDATPRLIDIAVSAGLYAVLCGIAAVTRRRAVLATALTVQIMIYLSMAALPTAAWKDQPTFGSPQAGLPGAPMANPRQ